MRREDQERALEEVINRTIEGVVARGSSALENALADTIFYEQQRLKKAKPSAKKSKEVALYERCRRQVLRGSDGQRQAALREIVSFFAHEILGNFNPRVHAVATRAVPFGLKALLNATSPRQLVEWRGPGGVDLGEHLHVDGEVDHARALRDRGTLVFAPTHGSNLDSIVLGYGMHEAGFPPLLYGAGLNLFENPLVSFFMRNLGAYTVDRRKKAPLYKEVLKTYATVSLELGYHNLFFPGGTRSRGGLLEQKLKLGLLGTGLTAYGNNLRKQAPKERVFVVPVVLSFSLVLEAETLVDDFLREQGRSRYIITDDEFSSPRRIYQFLRGLMDLDARLHLTVMEPLDPFGNPVDREGRSLDGRGREIQIERYLMNHKGEFTEDPNRDAEYTRELGRQVADAYLRGNTLLPPAVVAFALFEHLRGLNPSMDLYRFLRTGGAVESIAFSDAVQAVKQVQDQVTDLARRGRVRLGSRVRDLGPEDLLVHALRAFGTYHTRPAIERTGDRVYHRDSNLLFYYRNRLVGYGLNEGGSE